LLSVKRKFSAVVLRCSETLHSMSID
jgi:hypothetical protein